MIIDDMLKRSFDKGASFGDSLSEQSKAATSRFLKKNWSLVEDNGQTRPTGAIFDLNLTVSAYKVALGALLVPVVDDSSSRGRKNTVAYYATRTERHGVIFIDAQEGAEAKGVDIGASIFEESPVDAWLRLHEGGRQLMLPMSPEDRERALGKFALVCKIAGAMPLDKDEEFITCHVPLPQHQAVAS